MSSSQSTKGAWYVGLAYAFWGFFPIYWKALVGLSPLQLICHRIVASHSGEISVQSEEGAGTTFSIALPIRRAAE